MRAGVLARRGCSREDARRLARGLLRSAPPRARPPGFAAPLMGCARGHGGCWCMHDRRAPGDPRALGCALGGGPTRDAPRVGERTGRAQRASTARSAGRHEPVFPDDSSVICDPHWQSIVLTCFDRIIDQGRSLYRRGVPLVPPGCATYCPDAGDGAAAGPPSWRRSPSTPRDVRGKPGFLIIPQDARSSPNSGMGYLADDAIGADQATMLLPTRGASRVGPPPRAQPSARGSPSGLARSAQAAGPPVVRAPPPAVAAYTHPTAKQRTPGGAREAERIGGGREPSAARPRASTTPARAPTPASSLRRLPTRSQALDRRVPARAPGVSHHFVEALEAGALAVLAASQAKRSASPRLTSSLEAIAERLFEPEASGRPPPAETRASALNARCARTRGSVLRPRCRSLSLQRAEQIPMGEAFDPGEWRQNSTPE
jgi:hypothetical protein